jgi:hypothetical protein
MPPSARFPSQQIHINQKDTYSRPLAHGLLVESDESAPSETLT